MIRPHPRTGLIAACAITLVIATACGGSAPEPAAGSAGDSAASSTDSSHRTAGAAGAVDQSSPDGLSTAPQATAAGSGAGPRDRRPTNADNNQRVNQPSGLRDESPYVLQLEAVMSPKCVRAGDTATVTVTTAPGAAIGYVAVYAGEKSGAPPPFGYGYGGNAAGYADGTGAWTQTWTVRADAPLGPARTTVVAASHQTNEQVDVPFTVVDPVTGKC